MKNQASSPQNPQAGNVFFIILLGIVLFAALSYAVSGSMRGGAEQMSKEKLKIAATEIISYLTQVDARFDALVIQGCDPLRINFDSDTYTRVDGNDLNAPPASPQASCVMFAPNDSSGITPVKFPEYISTTYAPGATNPAPGTFAFRYVDVANGGTSQHDLYASMTGTDLNVCLAVLNMISPDSNFTSVPITTFQTGGTNTYTMGTPGTLNQMILPTSSNIWALRFASSSSYCQVGTILRFN